jgi:aspartate carbamoyltransferase catalytic subunit
MKKSLVGRDLVSITDLSKEEIESILAAAARFQKVKKSDHLHGSLLANCFFEPSTRTRLSFEAAMHNLGGAVIGFAESGTTSARKGETLSDSMKVIGSYVDIVVIRHPEEGAAQVAADAIDKPVINAGDGANQHPTQTLVDLFTIQECQGKIDGLHIGIAGDLKYGRTIHSLSLALSLYPVQLSFIGPKSLELPLSLAEELKKRGTRFQIYENLHEAMPHLDILYMTSIQKERFPEKVEIVNPCHLKLQDLKRGKKNLKMLHPLPRVGEIEKGIDATPYAYYFQQAANDVPVRMALLSSLLGKA